MPPEDNPCCRRCDKTRTHPLPRRRIGYDELAHNQRRTAIEPGDGGQIRRQPRGCMGDGLGIRIGASLVGSALRSIIGHPHCFPHLPQPSSWHPPHRGRPARGQRRVADAVPTHGRRGHGRDAQPAANKRNPATSTQGHMSRGRRKPPNVFQHLDGRYLEFCRNFTFFSRAYVF